MNKPLLMLAALSFGAPIYSWQNSANVNSQPKPPELWGHWVGQTIAEFFTAEGMTPEEYCAFRAMPSLGKEKVWPCTSPKGVEKGSVTQNMTVNFGYILLGFGGHIDPTRWAIFMDGQVTEIDAIMPDFEVTVADMTSKFGTPTTLKYDNMQNGFGATWRTGAAIWLLGDIAVTIIQNDEFGNSIAHVSMMKKPPTEQPPQNVFDR